MTVHNRWLSLLVIGLAIGFGYDAWCREQKLIDAEARAVKAQEALRQRSERDEERAFERVSEAAEALAEADPKVAKEALARFRQEIRRFKARHAYPQLGRPNEQEASP
jgi:hypothetical protein